jgi:hypothetical protein
MVVVAAAGVVWLVRNVLRPARRRVAKEVE